MNCYKDGQTKLLLTKIPFFREIIITSFSCEHCGFKNTEIQSGGQLQDYGHEITLNCIRGVDLSREVVKSEWASIRIPELDFEIPCSKKGSLNTIEGFLRQSIEEISFLQEERQKTIPEVAKQLEAFLAKLRDLADGNVFPFTFIVNDPSGNSFVKNPYAPTEDPNLKKNNYVRTKEQMNAMGFYPEHDSNNKENTAPNGLQPIQEEEEKSNGYVQKPEYRGIRKESNEAQGEFEKNIAHRFDFTKPMTEDVKGEALEFEVPCHSCQKMGTCSMCTTSIPYFKEIIVMSFLCNYCCAKSTEIKTGGSISQYGKKLTLTVEKLDDLKRDVFKSETAILQIPQIDLELDIGTLGGVYTTIEGLIDKIVENLRDNNPFCGDSAESDIKTRLSTFFKNMEELKLVKNPYTIIIDDPLNNSFIQNPYYPENDSQIKIETYQRTYEQNEEFGLNDLKTENY